MCRNWQIYTFDVLSSTNDKIKEYCAQKGQFVVVQAKTQTAGRGRQGRSWQSLNGNLFFSVALEFDMQFLGVLVFMSALSVLQTIKLFSQKAAVQLKWPNDVLLNNKKVSGILLEKGQGLYMIIGIGVNIEKSPDDTQVLYPTTSLREAQINTSADAFLQNYLRCFSRNMDLYTQNGAEAIYREWMQYAKGIGQKILVQQNKETKEGIFKGIDANGFLMLQNKCKTEKIAFGDVFYI